jgi:hypothetical protein
MRQGETGYGQSSGPLIGTSAPQVGKRTLVDQESQRGVPSPVQMQGAGGATPAAPSAVPAQQQPASHVDRLIQLLTHQYMRLHRQDRGARRSCRRSTPSSSLTRLRPTDLGPLWLSV